MDEALDSYDVCTGILKSKRQDGGEEENFTIVLPNLRVDATISLEEVSHALGTLRKQNIPLAQDCPAQILMFC